mgnify:CR=1 FL=1
MPSSLPGKLHKKQRSNTVKQAIVHIALVVRDYDEAIEFYTNKLHFTLAEDTISRSRISAGLLYH